MDNRPIRVLLAKPGLDTHETGIKIITAALRDGGMEVIYMGVLQSHESIVRTALDEDVDVVGLSYLNGGHHALTEGIIGALRAAGCGDIAVICGGIIPAVDIPALTALGVKGVYNPGTPLGQIVDEVREFAAHRHRASTASA